MKNLLVCLMTFYLSIFTANAKVKLPTVLSDNLVLQQQTNASLWGYASPGHKVTITTSWNNTKRYRTKADKQGKWKIKIAVPKATAGSQEITISDGEPVKIKNVLIGEVWFCSGQSNMEMPVRGFAHQPVNGSLDIILNARPKVPIRMFTVQRKISNTPLEDCNGHWNENTPDGVAQCSATAYFFANYLNHILNIPIGLIISDWEGTYLQPWMSQESIEPLGYDMSHHNDSIINNSQYPHNRPCKLFNGMIAPILSYTIKGMIWYQGESNCYNPEEYEKLMPVFVRDLRKKFNVGDFPFYYVQIAPNHYSGDEKEKAPKLRLIQARLMKQIPNCGMAVTMDIGDPHSIHPADKETVGKRLAYWALAKDYNRNSFAYSGPIFNHMDIDGNKAYLYFDNTGGGVSPIEQDLSGFEMAGADGIYHPAHAYVEAWRGLLIVTCDKVSVPVKIRYGYVDYIKGSLFDNFGLPASPFCTADE